MKIKTQFVFTHSPDMILKAIENPKDPIIFHLSDDERIELITLAEMCVGANMDPHNEKELAQAVSYAEADLSSAIEDLFYEIAVENYCNASADYIEENVSGYRSAVPIEAHNMKNHEENTN